MAPDYRLGFVAWKNLSIERYTLWKWQENWSFHNYLEQYYIYIPNGFIHFFGLFQTCYLFTQKCMKHANVFEIVIWTSCHIALESKCCGLLVVSHPHLNIWIKLHLQDFWLFCYRVWDIVWGFEEKTIRNHHNDNVGVACSNIQIVLLTLPLSAVE